MRGDADRFGDVVVEPAKPSSIDHIGDAGSRGEQDVPNVCEPVAADVQVGSDRVRRVSYDIGLWATISTEDVEVGPGIDSDEHAVGVFDRHIAAARRSQVFQGHGDAVSRGGAGAGDVPGGHDTPEHSICGGGE